MSQFKPSFSTDVRIDLGPFDVRIRSDLPGVGEHLAALYGDFPVSSGQGAYLDLAVVSSPGARRWFRKQANLIVNAKRPFLPLPAELAGPLMEWGLNWTTGQHVHRWVSVHAAVVERGGRAMILAAPSGFGKSTLCAAMVFAGWRLFSDEFALISPADGLLSPCPRPISLKNASMAVIRDRHPAVTLTPERVDVEGARFVHARPPTESVRRSGERATPRWIVMPKYVAGERTRLDVIPKSRALIELTDQSFNYNYLGAAGYRCLADVVATADCFALEYSDLDDVLARLGALEPQ